MAGRRVTRSRNVCPDCNKVHDAKATGCQAATKEAALTACSRDWANFNPPPRRDPAEELPDSGGRQRNYAEDLVGMNINICAKR
jgi:hypothetical protein